MEGESRCSFSLQAQAMFTHQAALPSQKGGPPRPQVRGGEREDSSDRQTGPGFSSLVLGMCWGTRQANA